MHDKRQLTEILVEQLDVDLGITVKHAMHTWWFNLRKTGGMRLTSAGYKIFCESLDLACYRFNITDPLGFNQHMILSMDRKLQMPYYIHAVKGIPKQVIFFGSKEAVMVNLYGDLKKYLDNC